jgi:glycosyltransferase involved in cell wall biosynthesis
VLHVTTTDISLDLLLLPQLRAFADAGYEVVTASAPGDHVAAIDATGLRHEPIPAFTRTSNPLRDLAAAWQLARLIRRIRPDIVHTHNPKPGVIGRTVSWLLRVPLVVNTQHGLYAQPTDRRRRRWPVYAIERLAVMFSDVELVQNPEDVHTLVTTLRVPAGKVRLLGNGIDLQRFAPSPGTAAAGRAVRAEWGIADSEVIVGYVGRLTSEKGIEELLAAAEILRRQHPDVRFVLVGPDEMSDAPLRTRVDDARRDGVVVTGLRTDMPACYAAFDIFVTATWREGFPRAAMEASAMGLPVIATDVRGCRKVVDDGTTGLLVPVRDAAALASAVERLVADAECRRRFGGAARDKAAREFDDRDVIRRTLDAYHLLTATRRGR